MFKKRTSVDFIRERVKGIFFMNQMADKAHCKQLLEELGCRVVLENNASITILANRDRLKILKDHHTATADDNAQISSRLKANFDRILIGGGSKR